MILISKTAKQIVLFFETNFLNLDLTIERCSENPLTSVVLDIGEKIKAFTLIPLYLCLELIFRMIDDSEKVPYPFFIKAKRLSKAETV